MTSGPTVAPPSTGVVSLQGAARRSLASWLAGAFLFITTNPLSFLVTPWLLRYLGPEQYGAWQAMGQWLGYIGLGQIGIAAPLTILLLRVQSKGSPTEVAAVVRRGLTLYLLVAVLTLIPGIGLAWMLPLWLHVPPALFPKMRTAAFVLVTAGFFLAPAEAFHGVLQSGQRSYLVRFGFLAQACCMYGLSILLVSRGWGLVGMACASVAGLSVNAVLMVVTTRRFIPSPFSVAPAPIVAGEFWSQSWPMVLAALAERVNLLSDNLVAGWLFGPAPVAVFYLSQRAVVSIAAFVKDIGGVSWAALGTLHHRGDMAGYQSRLMEILRTMVGAAGVLIGTAVAFDQRFVTLWVGPSQFGGTGMAVWTGAAALVTALVWLFNASLDTLGHARRRLHVTLPGAFLNVLASILLAHELGLMGIPLGTVVACLATDFWYSLRLLSRVAHISCPAILRTIGEGLLRSLPWALLVWVMAHRADGRDDWFRLVRDAGSVTVAGLFYFWWFALKSADRSGWMNRLRFLSPRGACR